MVRTYVEDSTLGRPAVPVEQSPPGAESKYKTSTMPVEQSPPGAGSKYKTSTMPGDTDVGNRRESIKPSSLNEFAHDMSPLKRWHAMNQCADQSTLAEFIRLSRPPPGFFIRRCRQIWWLLGKEW
eukprot:2877457-Prymnesium_polylepis.1